MLLSKSYAHLVTYMVMTEVEKQKAFPNNIYKYSIRVLIEALFILAYFCRSLCFFQINAELLTKWVLLLFFSHAFLIKRSHSIFF